MTAPSGGQKRTCHCQCSYSKTFTCFDQTETLSVVSSVYPPSRNNEKYARTSGSLVKLNTMAGPDAGAR